jgi:hypothetical protein
MPRRDLPSPHTRRPLSSTRLLPCLALATCFSGEVTRGLPCTSSTACGGGLECVEGICGGDESEPATRTVLSVLFVVTDDPDAGELQTRLAAAAPAFVDILIKEDLDFRVGVISTAMDHPQCAAGDDGALQLTSCRDREAEFPGEDLFTAACTALCPEDVQGDAAEPLPIDLGEGPERAPPWVQVGPDLEQSPLIGDLEPDQYIGCYLPRGVTGCRYEQPLAALVRALERMRDPTDPNYGFVSDGGLLAVIFIGRGNECSYAADAAAIFDPDGPRTFWSEGLESADPSICWHAGAACTNLDPEEHRWFECHSVDLAADGSPASPDDAVLLPVDATAESVRQAVTDLGAELLVAGVLGIPSDYAGGPLPYLEPMPATPETPAPFGVAPGCSVTGLDAAPPLRLQAFGAALDPSGMFLASVCGSPDKPLAALARQLAMQMKMPLQGEP